MSSGTFVYAGPTQIDLDGDCFLMPDVAAPVATHKPTIQVGEALFDIGGESQTLHVVGECQRHNLGDAEWYLYQKLLALGQSTTGALTVNGQAYGNCAFQSGSGEIAGHTWVSYRHEFLQGDNSSGAAGTAAAMVAEYGGRSSAGAFTFGGTALGDHAQITEVRVSRSLIVKHLGRGRGVRIKDLATARSVTLNLKCWKSHTTRAALEAYLLGLEQTLGSCDGSLVGNGNTFSNCHLRAIRTDGSRDDLGTYFTAEIVQEV